MKKSTQIKDVLSFGKNNWFSISLFLLFCAIVVKNDWSLSLTLNSSEAPKEEVQAPNLDKEPSSLKSQRNNKITQKTTKKLPIAKGNMTFVNPFSLFDSPSIPKETAPAPAVRQTKELMTIEERTHHQFINRFSKVAVGEMHKFGIPASIILAQGLLSSAAGQSKAAKSSNNYFQLPCTEDWKKGKRNYSGKCQRTYKTAWQSFRDHSTYITKGQYKYLNRFPTTNYHEWSKALHQIGYLDSPDYDKQLVHVIEKYELSKFDKL